MKLFRIIFITILLTEIVFASLAAFGNIIETDNHLLNLGIISFTSPITRGSIFILFLSILMALLTRKLYNAYFR